MYQTILQIKLCMDFRPITLYTSCHQPEGQDHRTLKIFNCRVIIQKCSMKIKNNVSNYKLCMDFRPITLYTSCHQSEGQDHRTLKIFNCRAIIQKCSMKIKNNVSNYSTNKTVHGLSSYYFSYAQAVPLADSIFKILPARESRS